MPEHTAPITTSENPPISSSTDTSNKPRLDHIIILLPYKDLLNPPKWLSPFTLTPGGRHADNKTENKLIVFHDGSYIELIAFIDDDPKHREGHWWGDKPFGIIDFAFTTHGDARAHWEGVQERLSRLDPELNAKYGYQKPVSGGRKRDDGEEVKWEVTFPQGCRRGELPFFCHEVTARELRVPLTKENCMHPCQAYGIKSLSVKVPEKKAKELVKVYEGVLGEKGVNDGAHDDLFKVWRVDGPGTEMPEICIHDVSDENEERMKVLDKQGVILGDLVIGVFGPLDGGNQYFRVDVEEDYGMILLHQDLPTRWALDV